MTNAIITIFSSNFMMIASTVILTVLTFNTINLLTDGWSIKRYSVAGLLCGLFNGCAAVGLNYLIHTFYAILPLISAPLLLIIELFIFTRERKKITYIFYFFCIAVNYVAFYDGLSSMLHLWHYLDNNTFEVGSYVYRNLLFTFTNLVTALAFFIVSNAKWFPVQELKAIVHSYSKGITLISYIVPATLIITFTQVMFSPTTNSVQTGSFEYILYINMALKTFLILQGGYLIIFIQAFQEKLVSRAESLEESLLAAQNDPLTDLLNRKGAEKEIRDRILQNEFGTLFMLDLDKFKEVNDSLGHPVGDDLLIDVAKKLHHFFRAGDIICRLGGDEFMIFAVGLCDESIIASRANMLNEKLRIDMPLEDGSVIPVSASIGISICPIHSSDFKELYGYADKALYEAKRLGRNTFSIYKAH